MSTLICEKGYYLLKTTAFNKCGCTTFIALCMSGILHQSSCCFQYPQKNPYLNQATKKKTTCQNFFTQKLLESKLSNLQKSFAHDFKSRVPPLGFSLGLPFQDYLSFAEWRQNMDLVVGGSHMETYPHCLITQAFFVLWVFSELKF